jgi:hypothetical protein
MGQVLYPPNPFPVPLPTTLAGGATWLSGIILGDGYRYITMALTSTQAGTCTIQEYLDIAGSIARVVSTTSIVANTPLIVDISDLKPFVTLTVSISNSSGSVATLSNVQLILAAG